MKYFCCGSTRGGSTLGRIDRKSPEPGTTALGADVGGSPFHDSMTHDVMTLTKLKDDSRFMTPVL